MTSLSQLSKGKSERLVKSLWGRCGCDRMVVGLITICNQCLLVSSLKLWVQISLRRGVPDTTLCDKVCRWLATSQWFSPGTPPPIKLTATCTLSCCICHTIMLYLVHYHAVSGTLSCCICHTIMLFLAHYHAVSATLSCCIWYTIMLYLVHYHAVSGYYIQFIEIHKKVKFHNLRNIESSLMYWLACLLWVW